MVLADDFVETGRPHPDRQWRRSGQPLLSDVLYLSSEQPFTEEGLILIHTAKVPPRTTTHASSAINQRAAQIAVIPPGAQHQYQDSRDGDTGEVYQ
jgi:hypothetical protein